MYLKCNKGVKDPDNLNIFALKNSIWKYIDNNGEGWIDLEEVWPGEGMLVSFEVSTVVECFEVHNYIDKNKPLIERLWHEYNNIS